MMVAIDTDSFKARLPPPCEEVSPGLLIDGARDSGWIHWTTGFTGQTDPAVAADMGPRPGLGA